MELIVLSCVLSEAEYLFEWTSGCAGYRHLPDVPCHSILECANECQHQQECVAFEWVPGNEEKCYIFGCIVGADAIEGRQCFQRHNLTNAP